jgi:hypothetical protein
MLLALLLVLGIPPLLVAAVLLAMLWHRRQVSRRPGVFRVTVREVSPGPASSLGQKSKTQSGHAEWIHDVLLVYIGLGRHRTLPMAAAGASGRIERVRPPEAKHLGDESAGLTVRLDDGTTVRVVTAASAASLLAGPYVSTVLPPVMRQATRAT